MEKVDALKLGGGAIGELLNRGLEEAIKNIQDLNTKASAVRAVRLTIKLKPDVNREFVQYELHLVTKLAPVREHEGTALVGVKDGKVVLLESNPNQLTIEQVLDEKGGK